MRSNLRLRSNVYLREGDLRNDVNYRSKIHGRKALRKLLDAIEVYDTPDRAVRWLTSEQLLEWREESRCAMCKTQVVGPIKEGSNSRIEFRCPHGRCPYEKQARA